MSTHLRVVPLEPWEHHWRYGITFQPTRDGKVRLRVPNFGDSLIPAAEWESIVDAVKRGAIALAEGRTTQESEG